MSKALTSPSLESPHQDRPALVVFSGGQDSTTCLFWAIDRFARVEAIAFEYGQRHRVEIDQAREIAHLAGVPLTVLDFGGMMKGSALLDHAADVNEPHERSPELPASFVPGRNALFLTAAASMGFARGITDLVAGMSQTDYSGYPDCRLDFVEAQQRTLSLALDSEIRIHTPLMYLTKAETWKLAADLGTVDEVDVLETVRELSHTDYHGVRSERHAWGYGRLDNPASILRARGYEEALENGWIPQNRD